MTDEQIREALDSGATPDDVAMAMVDEAVSGGEYEGCSTELELAYPEYLRRVEEVREEAYVEAMTEALITPEQSAAYTEYVNRESKRGELAGTPIALPCMRCTAKLGDPRYGDPFDAATCVQVKVIALGPIAEAHRDPTQTYRLACGHVEI